jgi:Plasma-membrane choline transporter
MSLLLLLLQTIRAVIAYFQKKAKATGNKIAQYALCCCQCCFWCLEKCMKFLNKNAYIQTALFSTSFCKSSREAFYLIARNIARVGAVGVISEFVIIIMKLVICLATMGATYLGMKAKVCFSRYFTVTLQQLHSWQLQSIVAIDASSSEVHCVLCAAHCAACLAHSRMVLATTQQLILQTIRCSQHNAINYVLTQPLLLSTCYTPVSHEHMNTHTHTD